MENKQKIFIGVLIGVVVLSVVGFFVLPKGSKSVADAKYAPLAQCLKDKGATFYGAFWCSHCNEQKKMFGSARSLLPYVECSTPDSQAQTPICLEKNIEGYPTWEFADGSRLNGKVSFEVLAEKTGCVLPE